MPAYARRAIVDESTVGMYHCMSRCVRRAWLCGRAALTGRNFDHRKAWIRKRLEQLAGLFAVDVAGYSVMSNHLHVVLRNRPDLTKSWSDEEVARRWCRLFPKRLVEPGQAPDPEPQGLAFLLANPKAIAERRRRLSSLSWFMRCLCEPIARRANREDECDGRFWSGRFKSQVLVDETAILTCSVYVDLNPVRAGVSRTPEESEYTSAYDRIASRQKAQSRRRVSRRVLRSRSKRGIAAIEQDPAGWL